MKSASPPVFFWSCAVVVSAVVGGFFGWSLGIDSGNTRRVSLGPLIEETAPVAIVKTKVLLEPVPGDSELAEFEEEPVAVAASGSEPTGFSTMLAELESLGLRVVPEKYFSQIEVPVLVPEEQGKLTDEVIELLALGEEEVARLNESLGNAVERLNAAEMKGLQMIEVSDTKAVFEIPAVSELGDEVEANLRAEVLSVLGERDGGAFLDLMNRGSGDFWNEFGREGRRISFSAEPEEGGRVSLNVKDEVMGEGRTSSRSTSTTPGDLNRGGNRFGSSGSRQDYLLDLLPEHLRAYF